MSNYFKWYSRVTWTGIVANLGLSIPALVAPNRVLGWLGYPPASPAMWPSAAGNLLILLSLFYIAPAIDPARHEGSAWLSVAARLAGVIFFCGFHRDYLLFGLFDLTFLLPQTLLLTLAKREA